MDLSRLVVSGFPTQDQCMDQWESIVSRHCEKLGNNEYINYFRSFKKYWLRRNEYTIVNAILTRLMLPRGFKQEWVDELNRRRLKVRTTTEEIYRTDLELVSRKCKAMLTEIALLKKELDDYAKATSEERQGFESIMAWLCEGLRREVPDTITLARYDEYVTIIKKRNKPRNDAAI